MYCEIFQLEIFYLTDFLLLAIYRRFLKKQLCAPKSSNVNHRLGPSPAVRTFEVYYVVSNALYDPPIAVCEV